MVGQFTNDCDIRIKFVGTPQQIGDSSTDVYESGLSRMKEVYVALHESRGTVPLCRRPHGWVAALVINRYGEDSSL
jgi:hypothetical protein